jgi:hypothetical protein
MPKSQASYRPGEKSGLPGAADKRAPGMGPLSLVRHSVLLPENVKEAFDGRRIGNTNLDQVSEKGECCSR